MALNRKLIRSEQYEGRTLDARHMGPDVLGFVDGIELSGFFVDAQAAMDAGRRHVDAEIKAQRDKDAKAQKESPSAAAR